MLHGEIKLNDVVIGEWTATRKDSRLPRTKEFNDYVCTIWYRDTDGYIYQAEWEFWGHHHGNGALSLAARVIQEGMGKAKKKMESLEHD